MLNVKFGSVTFGKKPERTSSCSSNADGIHRKAFELILSASLIWHAKDIQRLANWFIEFVCNYFFCASD
ncbi:hypothetical protein H5410_046805 [Solanum commersonii]|uniref:Uncharacterized protein n=1 Tax=Solanum commersonii TaxID=4109 RepID=A0A9J5XDA8_SOLCO|nr:hypothetical protein H5410_046805 [Solanum commersonii]